MSAERRGMLVHLIEIPLLVRNCVQRASGAPLLVTAV